MYTLSLVVGFIIDCIS